MTEGSEYGKREGVDPRRKTGRKVVGLEHSPTGTTASLP